MDNYQPLGWWVVFWMDRSGRQQQNLFTSKAAATDFMALIRGAWSSYSMPQGKSVAPKARLRYRKAAYTFVAPTTDAICAMIEIANVSLASTLSKRGSD